MYCAQMDFHMKANVNVLYTFCTSVVYFFKICSDEHVTSKMYHIIYTLYKNEKQFQFKCCKKDIYSLQSVSQKVIWKGLVYMPQEITRLRSYYVQFSENHFIYRRTTKAALQHQNLLLGKQKLDPPKVSPACQS